MNNIIKNQARQGDVFIERIEEKLDEYEKIPLDNNKIVLAYGEKTGHSHAVTSKNAILGKINNKIFLMVIKNDKDNFLGHEEHGVIRLPINNYKVTRQKHYTPGRIINVAD